MAQVQTDEKSAQDDLLQLSLFYLDDTLCGINIDQVQEINEELTITNVPLSPDYVMGIMNLRGQIITVVNLAMKIGLSPSTITPLSRVVIVSSKGENIGLLVDKISDVITIPQSKIADSPANIKGAQDIFFEGIFHTETHELMALINVRVVLENE